MSEGCLCSFNREGLVLQRRVPGGRQRFERVDVGLATVPMAVAASSAFPGFFPPLELRAWDVGANEGEFGRQLFTDGGVFDNLGLRMFRCIEQSWMRSTSPLRASDLIDPGAVRAALAGAANHSEETPQKKIAQLLLHGAGGDDAGESAGQRGGARARPVGRRAERQPGARPSLRGHPGWRTPTPTRCCSTRARTAARSSGATACGSVASCSTRRCARRSASPGCGRPTAASTPSS